jgi:hypothetical protein
LPFDDCKLRIELQLCPAAARRLDHCMDMAAVRPGRKFSGLSFRLGIRDELLEGTSNNSTPGGETSNQIQGTHEI